MAERTGYPSLLSLWSYVKDERLMIYLYDSASETGWQSLQRMKENKFRDIGNLTAVPASDLKLQLKDFGPKTLVGRSKSISIPSFLFYGSLVRAESVDKLTKERKREMDQLELEMKNAENASGEKRTQRMNK
ncbi:hypothetical protein MMC29_001881, partial [Sticta canariensis]|nr:hypothetical protein [Sticta canariensis]